MSNYTITDKNNNLYTFPDTFELDSQSDENNSNIVNTSYAAGGRDIADKFLRPKTVVLIGQLQFDTAAAFETGKRAFVQGCLKGGDLRFTGDPVSRFLEVKLISIDWSALEGSEGEYKFQEVSVTFSAEKVFWKANSETEDDNTVTGNDTLSIANSGSDYLVKPIIKIEADQAVNVPGVKMINNSDGGMSFTYNDSDFLVGDVLLIDCAKGTVQKNNNNTIEDFDGAFLRLQPGSNSIEYEGAACTITFIFRKVYL